MKKIISILLTILMTVCCFSPYYAFAAENEENKYDCTVYQNESYASIESISLCSSNLITKNSFSIRKNGKCSHSQKKRYSKRNNIEHIILKNSMPVLLPAYSTEENNFTEYVL